MTTNIPLAPSDWRRDFAKSAQIPLLNRFFENDPVVNEGTAALLARPALRKWLDVGSGPIRGMFSQKGMFGNALFVVSDDSLYKIDPDETITLIGTGILGSPGSYVPMCCTDNYLFLADGGNLWYYTDNGLASGTLTSTGVIINGEQVRVGSMYYQWTSGSVDSGTPLGTTGAPWLLKLGATAELSLETLHAAINGTGTAGTDYTTSLEANVEASAESVTPTTLTVRALERGAGGNAIVTTETGANLAWGAGTLAGGGATVFTTIDMPDDVGALWVDTIASHVLIVVSQGYGMNGRFYWIEPGEVSVDPLNFATAERAPDPLYSVITLGDQFWLFGSSTTEVWYPTGNFEAPFQRIQGRLFDRGIWEGTAVKVGDELIVTDADAVVWRVGSNGIRRVSNNSVEQRIREAIALEIQS